MREPAVLLLHGFTSSLDTVNGLLPHLEREGIPYRMPVLRGHCTRPEDMVGTTWRDWLEDGRAALLDLTRDGAPAIVVGLSMGGLVALNLAAEHPARVAAVATVAACLEFRSPLTRLLPVLERVKEWWPSSPDYADPSLVAGDTNYCRFPTACFASLFQYREVVKSLLPHVKAPLLVIQSTADPVVREDAGSQILRGVGSAHREARWFHRSRHEMMRDVEREEVFEALMGFVRRVRAGEFVPAA